MTPLTVPPAWMSLCAAGRRGVALYLDIDGALLDLRDDPAAVRADPPLLDLLDRLSHRLDGALALVSGRDLTAIDRIFAPRRYPAAGTHGAEVRLIGGVILQQDRDPQLMVVADTLLARCPAGLRLERKSLSLALHFRGVPWLRAAAFQLAASALAALGVGYGLKPGKDVVEIAPATADKGRAVDLLAAHPPFSGRLPVFVGDDITDEQGFAAVNRAGGASIRIGAPAVPTQAQFALADPAALRRWLAGGLSMQFP